MKRNLFIIKKKGRAAEFYKSALQYLSFNSLLLNSQITPSQRIELAHDVCIAAIVSEEVFNFGEVLAQGIIQELKNSKENQWLLELIISLDQGNVDNFNNILMKNRTTFEKNPTLMVSKEIMKQKIALCCLMKIVFNRPPHLRDVSFVEISKETHLPLEQVEWLIMRAFAKNLMKGTMNQTTETLHVTWLQPRVLNDDQIKVLDSKLISWMEKINETLKFELIAPELFNAS